MKKFLIAFGCILLAIILVVGYIAYVNRGNIESFITAVKYDDQQINTRREEARETLKTDIDKYFDEGIREFTEEETKAIESGEKTSQQVLAEIIMEEAPKKPAQSAESIIAKYTAKILELEGKYGGQVEALLKGASQEYRDLPKGQHTYQNKIKIMTKHIKTINNWESSCDKEVEGYLSAMEKELKAIGADTSIVNTARESYKNEKQLRKAAYLKEYGD